MNEKPIQKEKLWNSNYIFLLFIGTLISTNFSMVTPVITKYATHLEASLPVAGLIAGMFSITALVARPFSGVLSDRFNKKIVFVVGTTMLAIATLLYSFSVSMPLLAISRILHGIGFAVSGTSNIALITNFIPKERIGEGIGYYGLGHIVAQAIGPNIGVIIGNRFGLKITFLVSSIILFLTVCVSKKIPNIGINSEKSGALPIHNKVVMEDFISLDILPLALIGGIISLSNGLVSSFLVLIGEEREIKNIVLYFTVNAICLFFIRPIAGRLSDKKGVSYILYPSLALILIESLLLSNANALWIVLIAAICKAFGQGTAQPILQSTCIKKLGLSRSGVATSTFYIGADIGQGIAPIIGGIIATKFGFNVMFYCCASLLLLNLIAYYLYDKNDKKEHSCNELK